TCFCVMLSAWVRSASAIASVSLTFTLISTVRRVGRTTAGGIDRPPLAATWRRRLASGLSTERAKTAGCHCKSFPLVRGHEITPSRLTVFTTFPKCGNRQRGAWIGLLALEGWLE